MGQHGGLWVSEVLASRMAEKDGTGCRSGGKGQDTGLWVGMGVCGSAM